MAHPDPADVSAALSRRRFLRLGATAGLAAGASGVLAGCSAPPPAATAKPAAPPAAAPPAAGGSSSPLKVRYAVARGGLGDWGSFVALDKGFFAAEGVDMEHTLLGSFVDVATGIISGQLDVGVVSIPTAISWSLQSQPGKLLCASQMATPQGKYNNWWCAAPDAAIQSPTDVRGKKVHVLGPNSLAQMVTRTVLRKHGVLPGEYEELSFGFDQSYTGIKTGRADVSLFIEPFYTSSNKLARDEYGGREMRVVYTMLDAFPTGMHLAALAVNTNWLAQNQEAGRRFVRAQLRAAAWGRDNPEELKQILAKYAEVPYENIKDTIPAEMSTDGKFLPGFIQQLQQYMLVEKTIPNLTEALPDDRLVASGVLPSG